MWFRITSKFKSFFFKKSQFKILLQSIFYASMVFFKKNNFFESFLIKYLNYWLLEEFLCIFNDLTNKKAFVKVNKSIIFLHCKLNSFFNKSFVIIVSLKKYHVYYQ